MMFRELVNVRYSNREFKDLPLYRTTQWLWFCTALFYTYGSSFFSEKYLPLVGSPLARQLLPFVELISLFLYSAMLITTVLTLKKGYYKYQMGQLAWTISTIVITVVQVSALPDSTRETRTHTATGAQATACPPFLLAVRLNHAALAQVKSFTDNIFSGLFWFLFPVSLVICNDSMAYFCGMACGRKFVKRPFLSISPNKTWEVRGARAELQVLTPPPAASARRVTALATALAAHALPPDAPLPSYPRCPSHPPGRASSEAQFAPASLRSPSRAFWSR